MTGNMEGQFYFDPEDPIYKAHFPGHPVVPGSVVIHAFLTAMKSECRQGPLEIEQFRFKRFISPGSYRYTITMDQGKARCTLLDSDKTVVTGVIHP